jgi:polysaccharide chain length determinant protein (PEP-CTERM system associated)
MLERLSIPRRALDFEDYVDIMRRNFRWLIGPAFAGLVISTVVAYFMQDTYVSRALVRIVPQQIADNLVQIVSSQQLVDHIQGMAESILSRNTLTNLITTFHLYKKDLKSEPMEDVITKMKSSIKIGATQGMANMSGRSIPAMEITFTYDDAHLAKAVCDDIVSRFVNQNTEDSLASQEQANQFMNDEFEKAQRDLSTIDNKLADFRTRNAGRLPEQMELNAQEMNSLTQRAQQLSDLVNRNNEQKMFIESAMRTAKDRLNSIKDVTPQSQARNDRVLELDRQIQNLQTQIEDMKDRYTDNFPDLQSARQQLSVLKKQRDQAEKEQPAKTTASTVENPAITREKQDAQTQVDQLQTQLKANAMEAQQITRQMTAVNADLQNYQNRLEGIPASEKEYMELMHERDLAKQHYDDLEGKRNRSRLSVDMEKRKQGETLEVLDSASMPAAPTAPKRSMIVPAGAGIGFILGIVLVGIREVKDTSLKNLKDARLYTQLSILGSIPLLENDLVVQRRRQIMLVGWATATVVGLAIMGFSIAHYYLNLNKA